jgi:hypothetical protein
VLDLRRELRLATWPVVIVSPHVSSPVLVGAVRPKIVLPTGLVESSSQDEIRLFLVHELTHLRRGDVWFGWAWCIALCLHWFNPVLWWAGTAIRRDREIACDAHVLTRIGSDDASRYGHALLNAIDSGNDSAVPMPAFGVAGIVEKFGELKRRIEMISHYTTTRNTRRWPSLAAITVVGLAALVSIGSVAQDTTNLENPFAAVNDESQLADECKAAIADGDLIRACDAEMRRVEIRGEQGNPWKDKIDLVQIVIAMRQANDGTLPDAKNKLEAAEAYLSGHEGDVDYVWRAHQLAAAIAEDTGDQKRSMDELTKAMETYPRTKYAVPSKHSKFQHLVNEMAMKIWDTEGVEAAEAYVVKMWQEDRRFVYFFDQPWIMRLNEESLPLARLDALRKKLGEKPPLKEVAVVLSPEGYQYQDKTMDWAELEKALKQVPDPYDHYITLALTTEDLPLSRFREAETRLLLLVQDQQFDHLSQIGVQ